MFVSNDEKLRNEEKTTKVWKKGYKNLEKQEKSFFKTFSSQVWRKSKKE